MYTFSLEPPNGATYRGNTEDVNIWRSIYRVQPRDDPCINSDNSVFESLGNPPNAREMFDVYFRFVRGKDIVG